MATFLERAGEAAVRAVRDTICFSGGLLLDNLPAFGPVSRALREFQRGQYAAICGVPTPPELGEPVQPPGPIGQCQGVAYRVFATGTGTFQGTPRGGESPTPVINPAFGPITSSFTGTGNNKNWRINFFNSAGNPVVADSGINEPSAFWENREWFISRTERVDGLPDDCGPLPPPIPPPPPPIPPPPPDYDYPVTPDGGGPDINFSFSPRIGPFFVGVGGAIFAPVNVRINGPNIDVNAPISIPVNISLPDLNISFGGGGGGPIEDPDLPPPPGPPPRIPPERPYPICCDPPPVPGPDIEVPADEPVEGPEPPPGFRLVAVLVRSSIVGNISATEIGQSGGSGNLFVPRIGSVYFTAIATSQGGTVRSGELSDISVKLLNQYVQVPDDVRAVNFRYVPIPGVAASVTPLYIRENPP